MGSLSIDRYVNTCSSSEGDASIPKVSHKSQTCPEFLTLSCLIARDLVIPDFIARSKLDQSFNTAFKIKAEKS